MLPDRLDENTEANPVIAVIAENLEAGAGIGAILENLPAIFRLLQKRQIGPKRKIRRARHSVGKQKAARA
jgi:hypothetical protein